MNTFNRFPELFIPHQFRTTKKYRFQLEKEAIRWFEKTFNAVFIKTKRDNPFTWHYSAGLTFTAAKMGGYHYSYVLKMIHFEYLQLPAWKAGYRAGKLAHKSKNYDVDKLNPYREIDFYNTEAYQCGFTQGLAKFLYLKNGNKGARC